MRNGKNVSSHGYDINNLILSSEIVDIMLLQWFGGRLRRNPKQMLQIGICMLVVVFAIYSFTVRHATTHTTSYKFFRNGWKGFCQSFIQNPTTILKNDLRVEVHNVFIS